MDRNPRRIPHVRAVSDGLALICELRDGRWVGVPMHAIDNASEVRKPGGYGVLVIHHHIAAELGIAADASN